MSKVRAAGAVLWRHGTTGIEIAVVHRPRYDDWSLPKGKLDPGETAPAAAVRELAEETGYDAVLGGFLTTVEYVVGRIPKAVDYFTAHALSGQFHPNEEVDEMRWLSPARARPLLSYDSDVATLDQAVTRPFDVATVLLVRHGKAGQRDEWNGDDDLRPLSAAGQRQADALRPLLRAFRPEAVYSAPRLRCVQTVRGVAEDLGGEVVLEPLVSEESYRKDPTAGVKALLSIASAHPTSVVCSQGGVIPNVLTTLAETGGVELVRKETGDVPNKKGSVWLLSFAAGEDEHSPQLIAAHYLPTALPEPTTHRT